MSGSGATIARNSLWLLIDNLGGTVIALLTSIAVARMLGPEKYGQLQYVLWIAAMAKLVGEMGVPLATRKFVSEYRGRDDLVTVTSIVRATGRFQAVVATLIPFAGLALVFTVLPQAHRAYASLAALSLVPAFLMGVPTALLWSTQNLSFATQASLLGLGTNFVVLMISLLLGWDLPGIAAALLLGRLVDFGVRFRHYHHERKRLPRQAPPMDPALRRRLVRFCWHQSLLLAIEVVIWNRAEMLFLERYSTILQVGYFSQGFNLVQNLMLLPRLFAAAAGATLMVKQGASPQEVGRLGGKTLWVVAIVSLPTTFGLAALSSPVLRTLYGDRYLESITPLTILALFGLGRALSFPLFELLFATERQSFVVRWSFAMLFLNLALGFLWIPGGAAVGAAWVKGITQVVTMAGLWVFTARHMSLAFPMGRFLRLFASAAIMFGLVRLTVEPLHPAVGLMVGLPVGALVFALCVRLGRALAPEDTDFMIGLQHRLPRPLRRPFVGFLRLLSPAA